MKKSRPKFVNIENIKLKDRLEVLQENTTYETKTENPVEKLSFQEYRKRKQELFNYKFWLFLFVIFLLGASIFLNTLHLKRLDQGLLKLISTPAAFINEVFSSTQNFLYDQINKPYVVTLGEYGNFAIAKDEAIKLVPKLKQINIKQLNSGIYTFEIDKLASKNKAYAIANEFIEAGYDGVHVRYLPNQ